MQTLLPMLMQSGLYVCVLVMTVRRLAEMAKQLKLLFEIPRLALSRNQCMHTYSTFGVNDGGYSAIN